MAKYKVGDKVRVINLEDAEKMGRKIEYHGDGYISSIRNLKMHNSFESNVMCHEMLNFMGKVVTISSVSRQYSIKECSYFWTDEMFKGIFNNPNN